MRHEVDALDEAALESTLYTRVANTEVFNVGAAYDAATGALTVPVREVGDYLVMASALTPDAPLDLHTLVNSDGGNTWTTVSSAPRAVNGGRITDFLTLNDGAQVKFTVFNPGVAADGARASSTEFW